MTVQRLLATAFKDGCGISMERALRAPRYHELLAETATWAKAKDPIEELAMVEYLGECLADRAAQNLPIVVKNRLYLWDEGVEAQKQLISLLMLSMSSERWRSYGTRETTRKSWLVPLPAVTKSWERGPIQPNCLGLTQMLVGFARMVGANHYVVNVLHPFEQTLYETQREFMVEILDMLYKFQDDYQIRRIIKLAEEEYQHVLENLGFIQTRESHHAIALQLADGRWFLVDPYLQVLQPLAIDGKRNQRTLAKIDADHVRGVILSDTTRRKAAREFERQLVVCSVAIQYLLEAIEAEKTADTFDGSELSKMALMFANEYAGIKPGESLTELRERYSVVSFAYALFAEYAYFPEVYRKPGPNGKADHKTDQDEYDRRKYRVTHSRREYRRALRRMIRAAIMLLFATFDSSSRALAAKKHELIELDHPTMMLGCATLNHLRVLSGTHVHGRLMLYSSSQWVTYNSLAAAKHGDTLDAASARVVAKRAKRDQQLIESKMMLNRLRPLVEGSH